MSKWPRLALLAALQGILCFTPLLSAAALAATQPVTTAAKPTATAETARIERLAELADLWGRIYLLHPQTLLGKVSVGDLLIAALPQFEAARNDAERVAILNRLLLAPLGGPLNTAQTQADVTRPKLAQALQLKDLGGGSFLLDARVDAATWATADFPWQAQALLDKLEGTADKPAEKTLIVDLRFADGCQLPKIEPLLRLLTNRFMRYPGRLQRVHLGWNEFQSAHSTYHQSWETLAPEGWLTTWQQRDPSEEQFYAGHDFAKLKAFGGKVVFLLNRYSLLRYAEPVIALQTDHRFGWMLENSGHLAAGDGPEWFQAQGYSVHLDLQPLLQPNGALAVPDLILDQPPAEARLAELTKTLFAQRQPAQPLALLQSHVNDWPATSGKPETARQTRLYGLFKLWNVIRWLDPHTHQISGDWDQLLREWIPKVEQATTPAAYYLELRKLTAHLNDSHVSWSGPGLDYQNLGWVPPYQFAHVGPRLLVSRVFGKAAELQPGDEVLAFGSESVPAFEARNKMLLSDSTPGAFQRDLYLWTERSLAGPKGSALELTVRRQGRDVKLSIPRSLSSDERWALSDAHPAVRRIGSFGYLHGGVIANQAAFTAAIKQMGDTRGLIFDMRGYPKFGLQFALAPFTAKPYLTPIFEIPLLSAGTLDSHSSFHSQQMQVDVPPPAERPFAPYTKPLVVLIDETAQSAAEDICLYLRSIRPDARFVGRPTAGVDGNITHVSLPYDGGFTFTGMRVKSPDGQLFQNIGIVPDLRVDPTEAGLRAGRDEVLEAGLAELQHLTGH